ncbi:MAG: prephenate dehydrogenase/arogenate dehydrogenase family protein [Peptococcaceae bacterium]|nr:prephenate dehydrogenase/arogenate dehydrogenase family protein [Peptococcaceae bacterium]
MNQPTLAIIGLGLMGGSLAFALQGFRECKVIGFDVQKETADQALAAGAIQETAASLEEAVSQADIVLFCTAPAQLIQDLPRAQPCLKKGSVVTDICGVKKDIMAWVERCLRPDVSYVGIHPMAGKEIGGFVNADPDLFQGAGFILIQPEGGNPEAFQMVWDMVSYVGAGRIVVNPVEVHDNIIAYTSDLMHIAATGLCRRFSPDMTMAHTAGAFRDCTRIAAIDPALWTDLFMSNRDNILFYLAGYIEDLCVFQKALEDGDTEMLYKFLDQASRNKKEMMKL